MAAGDETAERDAEQRGFGAGGRGATATEAGAPDEIADRSAGVAAPGDPQYLVVSLPPQRSVGHYELLLSTFMLLTAFFAVLVALSDFEPKRTQMVLDSIAQVFATDIPAIDGLPFSAADEQAHFAAPVDDLRRLLERSLAVTAGDVDQEGEIMRFEFPASRLFLANGSLIRPERQVLLGRIADQLAKTTASPSPILYIAADIADDSPASMTSTLSRLAAVERRLHELGADPDRVVLGLIAGADDQWQFEFRYGS